MKTKNKKKGEKLKELEERVELLEKINDKQQRFNEILIKFMSANSDFWEKISRI